MMEYPMRVYGLNIFERILVDVMTAVSWLLMLFSIAVIIFPGVFFEKSIFGTLLIVFTFLCGIVLGIAGSGIRQNRSALAFGSLLLLLIAIGWLVNGFMPFKIAPLITTLVMLFCLLVIRLLRRRALTARFNPRFFTLRQFETMIQVADTMMDGDGQEIMGPIEIAIRADHMMAKIDSPVTKNIKLVMTLVEWLLPILIFRPFPFSTLGSNERRRVVQKVIGAKGIFRDVARSLKMLTCSGYYGSPKGMAQVGYIPYDDRERAQGIDQSPLVYADPFKGQ
jgi:hypothetical protein